MSEKKWDVRQWKIHFQNEFIFVSIKRRRKSSMSA